MLYPLHVINLNILQVKGRSDLYLRLEIIKKTIAVIPILLGIFISIEYLLWGSVFTSFIAFFLNSYYSGSIINYSTKQQIKDIFPTFVIAAVTSLIMWLFSFLPWNNWLVLLLQIVVGITMAISVYAKSGLPEYIELKNIVISFLSKYK